MHASEFIPVLQPAERRRIGQVYCTGLEINHIFTCLLQYKRQPVSIIVTYAKAPLVHSAIAVRILRELLRGGDKVIPRPAQVRWGDTRLGEKIG